jgi:hypothetical protein
VKIPNSVIFSYCSTVNRYGWGRSAGEVGINQSESAETGPLVGDEIVDMAGLSHTNSRTTGEANSMTA